jgi:hypothetical protein
MFDVLLALVVAVAPTLDTPCTDTPAGSICGPAGRRTWLGLPGSR